MLSAEILYFIKIRVKLLILYFSNLLNDKHSYSMYPSNFNALLIINDIEKLLKSSEYEFDKNFESHIIEWHFYEKKEDILIIISTLNKLLNI